MLPLNQLSAAERLIYNMTIRGVFGGYEMKPTVQILNNQHKVISTVSHRLLDGQVDGQMVRISGGDIEASRTCLLQFSDPKHTLAFDSSSPTDGALYLDRMVRVVMSVRCSFGWVDVPLFTGPVDPLDRDGDIVNLKASGKEVFGLRSAWETHNYKYGFKVKVLRSLLTRMGEVSRYIELPASRSRIPKTIAVGRETKLWVKAFALANSLDRHLFYDGRGIARAIPQTSKPVVTFDGSMLLSEPRPSFSTDGLKNAWIIKGGDPAGPKKIVSALVVAPRSSNLSPWKIGRDPVTGRGGFITGREDNPHLRTLAKAIKRGKFLLDQSLLMGVDATWESLPVWHLEPWDIANLATDNFNATVRVRKYSMPLRPDTVMTCGFHADLRKPKYKMRAA